MTLWYLPSTRRSFRTSLSLPLNYWRVWRLLIDSECASSAGLFSRNTDGLWLPIPHWHRGLKYRGRSQNTCSTRTKGACDELQKPSSGSLFVKRYCYSYAVIRWFVWSVERLLWQRVHSVRILLHIFSSLDGHICWTLNEFALFWSIKATFVFQFVLQRCTNEKRHRRLPIKLKLPIDVRTVSRWNSFRMMRGLEIKKEPIHSLNEKEILVRKEP